MSDPAFVAAAYAVVMGGLSLYTLSVARRVRAARRTLDAVERARDRPLPDLPGEPATPLAGHSSEARR